MKAGAGWPIGICVILASTVIANIALMRVANNDPSFAIEPEYYKKAVAFDATMAEERESARLGWKASARIESDSASGSQPRGHVVVVTLADSAGQPVVNATVSVHALYNARANNVVLVNLQPSAPGTYRAPLRADFVGQWEIRVVATRGSDRFSGTVRADVASSGTLQPQTELP